MRLTRRYRFSSSHRLDTPSLSPEENQRLYGKCNHPYGHGHDYIVDVTVEGRIDATGQVAGRDALDELVTSRVVEPLDHRDLNSEVPELKGKVPTTENLASAIERSLMQAWNLPARLHSVRIFETARNIFELEAARGR